MNTRYKIFAIASLLIICSCTTLKRYDSLKSSGTSDSLADISLFSSKLLQQQPARQQKSLWDLSADAQSQFIKILNTRFPENEMFLKSLSNVYAAYDFEMPETGYIRKDLRLVFSISRDREYGNKPSHLGSLSQADRLEYLKISLSLKEPVLKFTSWNMYSTEYGSISIGDVSFSRNLDIGIAGSLTPEKDVAELSASAKSSAGRKEDQSVGYRYIKLNGRISNNAIEMEEEGTREIDLTGNIIADVSLEFQSFSEIVTTIKGLKDSTGLFNKPGKMVIERSIVHVPDMKKIKEILEADLRMDYVYRNVGKGRKTYQEWDDRVRYYKGSVTKPAVLFTEADYVPEFCTIGTAGKDNKEFITITRPGGDSNPLVFRTYDEAAGFFEWLKWYSNQNQVRPLKIGGYSFQFDGKEPDWLAGIDNLMVIPWYF